MAYLMKKERMGNSHMQCENGGFKAVMYYLCIPVYLHRATEAWWNLEELFENCHTEYTTSHRLWGTC